jgi:hypothetical protein
MKLLVSILIALPILVAQARTIKTPTVSTVPTGVRVSGGFSIGQTEHEFDGFLSLRSSTKDATHFQGTAEVTGLGQANTSIERRINYLTRTKKGKSWAEFVIFRGNTYYQFHFPLAALLPSAGIPVKGTVTTFRERPCPQIWETVCYEELGTDPADITVSY